MHKSPRSSKERLGTEPGRPLPTEIPEASVTKAPTLKLSGKRATGKIPAAAGFLEVKHGGSGAGSFLGDDGGRENSAAQEGIRQQAQLEG